MLSRIMRHPAGLMRKALGGRFLCAIRPSQDFAVDATPPTYWAHRYSQPGLVLFASAAPASPANPIAPVPVPHSGDAVLSTQGGKASSFLTVARKPAARA